MVTGNIYQAHCRGILLGVKDRGVRSHETLVTDLTPVELPSEALSLDVRRYRLATHYEYFSGHASRLERAASVFA